MSGYVVPPGDGRSFGPGISVKVEHGASPDFAVFESVVRPFGPVPEHICTGPTTTRSTSSTAQSCSRWTG
jgi:hypothetical protein